jgi:hypothetical protein
MPQRKKSASQRRYASGAIGRKQKNGACLPVQSENKLAQNQEICSDRLYLTVDKANNQSQARGAL